jgi:hypothetical protein
VDFAALWWRHVMHVRHLTIFLRVKNFQRSGCPPSLVSARLDCIGTDLVDISFLFCNRYMSTGFYIPACSPINSTMFGSLLSHGHQPSNSNPWKAHRSGGDMHLEDVSMRETMSKIRPNGNMDSYYYIHKYPIKIYNIYANFFFVNIHKCSQSTKSI